MIPPEMFKKVIDQKTGKDKWLHVPVLDAIEWDEEDKYTVWINGQEHKVIIENVQKDFPFLFGHDIMEPHA